ncbi:MAG TPA: hypothetical protein DCF71_03110, partial [Gemmatimonadetes bacterium]|nr:hypothetical protein [Gemmatimonadota bacterium]
MRHEQGRSGEIRAPGPGGHHTHVGGRLRGGVPTGFGQLDELLGNGMQRSDMIVLAARPSLGKSSLAFNIARYAA